VLSLFPFSSTPLNARCGSPFCQLPWDHLHVRFMCPGCYASASLAGKINQLAHIHTHIFLYVPGPLGPPQRIFFRLSLTNPPSLQGIRCLGTGSPPTGEWDVLYAFFKFVSRLEVRSWRLSAGCGMRRCRPHHYVFGTGIRSSETLYPVASMLSSVPTTSTIHTILKIPMPGRPLDRSPVPRHLRHLLPRSPPLPSRLGPSLSSPTPNLTLQPRRRGSVPPWAKSRVPPTRTKRRSRRTNARRRTSQRRSLMEWC